MTQHDKLTQDLATVFHDTFGDWKVGYWSVAKAAVLKRDWSTVELAELVQSYLPGWKEENWTIIRKLGNLLTDAGFECRQRFSRGSIEWVDDETKETG
jgi:hypothetical protein